MKCPYCGSKFAGNPAYCPNCRQPLSRAFQAVNERAEAQTREADRHFGAVRIVLVVFTCILLALALMLGIYKIFYSASEYRIRRLYTRGAYTPTVNAVTMDDGRAGHTFVFYGVDGDSIFLPELNRSIPFCGGVARIEITDADWFRTDVEGIDAADITLTPVLLTASGGRTQLPSIQLTVDVPDAPLTIISPEKDRTSIVTSKYLMELQVVAGSTVTINGSDVTSEVDRSGLLSKNVNVYPIGDNTFTVVVDTPRHRETRQEVVIYRQSYDIEVELDDTVGNTSSNETIAVSGTIEPGADLVIETDYMDKSLLLDMSTGRFSFIANLKQYGDNTVRFRATMEGRQDAIVNLTINYLPTLAKYSSTAWAMDYEDLCEYYAQWEGRVFRCSGTVENIFREGEDMYVVMDVGSKRYVVLKNVSALASPVIGRKYTAYADVSGRYMYNAEYYPMLIARYIDVA